MDLDLVSRLKLVDLCTTSANQLTMEFGVDLEGVCCLVSPLSAESCDVCFGSCGLSLWALKLNNTVVNVDLNIELIAQVPDVGTTLSNKLIGMLLWKVKGCREATLLLILNGLGHKRIDLLSQRLNRGGWTLECHDSTCISDSDRNLICLAVLLLLLDESAQLIVEANIVS